jgi:RimJ/RimL family protein N-acetyltransferase
MDTRYDGKVPATCRRLLGPRYALVREDFRRLRGRVTPRTGSVQRILLFFGGGDAENVTDLAIRALANCGLKGVQVDVVIGAQHAHREHIEVMCRDQGFSCHVETTRMAELMSASDLAIGAGGTATWERCCMGVPALAFAVADNQQRVVEDAALEGLLYAPTTAPITVSSIERHVNALLDNPLLLQMMSRKAFDAVDGLGVNRVVHALDRDSILIREATMEDAEALFAWRNDESVRSVSRDPRRIEWPDHRAWLAGVMADQRQILVIGECAGAPVGVVRFEVTGDEAEVSIYMVPGSAGSGFGSRLLLAAESWLVARRRDIASVKAETLQNNRPSHRLFQSTGYAAQSTLYIKRMPVS